MKNILKITFQLIIVTMFIGCTNQTDKAGVMVLVDLQSKPDEVSNMKSFLTEVLPDTRSYTGCQSLEVFTNKDDDANLVLVEFWDTKAHYEEYLNWRGETGALDKLGEMIAKEPTIRYFNKTSSY